MCQDHKTVPPTAVPARSADQVDKDVRIGFDGVSHVRTEGVFTSELMKPVGEITVVK